MLSKPFFELNPSILMFENLPSIQNLKQISRSLAMLDAILEPEWEYRYFSFNQHWATGEQLGSMRDGEGSWYFILFNSNGVFLKGFEKDCPLGDFFRETETAYPGIFDEVPPLFVDALNEPAFGVGQATFCFWNQSDNHGWKRGKLEFPVSDDPDGAKALLKLLHGGPRAFQKWAEDYYERKVSIRVINSVFRHEPLTDALVARLNPDLSVADLAEDIEEIGFPVKTG